jgi:alpha/beta superfamily hydrolase
MRKVYFAHGKESGPWGSKIRHLASIAETNGYEVMSPDYSALPDPDTRVKHLLELLAQEPKTTDIVLAGSSMGGYVSTVVASSRPIKGLFLMAPALYIPGYGVQAYAPKTNHVYVVHGEHDDVIPLAHSQRFAKESTCTLQILDGDHRLNSVLLELGCCFETFLQKMAD